MSTEDRVNTKDMRKLKNRGMGNYLLEKYEWKESQGSNFNMKQNIIKGKKKKKRQMKRSSSYDRISIKRYTPKNMTLK